MYVESPVVFSRSAVERLYQFNPSPVDLARLKNTLQQLAVTPASGTLIPFASGQLPNSYVTWTPDGKWRIVFTPRHPSGLNVLLVEPETRR